MSWGATRVVRRDGADSASYRSVVRIGDLAKRRHGNLGYLAGYRVRLDLDLMLGGAHVESLLYKHKVLPATHLLLTADVRGMKRGRRRKVVFDVVFSDRFLTYDVLLLFRDALLLFRDALLLAYESFLLF